MARLRVTKFEQSRLKEIQNLSRLGHSAESIQGRIEAYNKGFVRKEIIVREQARLRAQQEKQERVIKRKRSVWVRQESAIPTEFRGAPETNFRYLWDFTFRVKDRITGAIRTISQTFGFRRLARFGQILDQIESRVFELIVPSKKEFYVESEEYLISGSIELGNLYRTVNR